MGEVVVSVDAELAWGYHDKETAPARIDDARKGWRTALDLFEQYEVPATWAVVGHLCLEECDGRHVDHPLGPDWFSCTPGWETVGDDWRASDLVATVRDSHPGHEIGCHTFSHVVMNDPEVTRSVAEAELRRSRAAAEALGVTLDSFVFPRNWIDHRDVLADHGITSYRGTIPPTWYGNSRLRPVLKVLDWTIGGGPQLVHPTVDEYGLVNVPASLYLFGFEGWARDVTRHAGLDPIVTAAKRGVEKAVETDGVFHVWFHPHNLLQPDGRSRLEAILAHVARRRSETDLTVRTMGDVARGVLDTRAVATRA